MGEGHQGGRHHGELASSKDNDMWKKMCSMVLMAHATCGVWAASGPHESYPSRPIRVIDGFPPGGSADSLARVIGPKITERHGQTVIVDNRPGAGGNVGAEIAA